MRDTFLGGPNNQDYSICGSILGSPCFGKLPYREFLGTTTLLNMQASTLGFGVPVSWQRIQSVLWILV